jgi:hypothetical protein
MMATARIGHDTDGTIRIEFSHVGGFSAPPEEESEAEEARLGAKKAQLDALFNLVVALSGVMNVTIDEIETPTTQCNIVVHCSTDGELVEIISRLRLCIVKALGPMAMMRAN